MYSEGGNTMKLETPVDFPLRLDAKDVCSSSPPDAEPLDLVAMVCHFGSKPMNTENVCKGKHI